MNELESALTRYHQESKAAATKWDRRTAIIQDFINRVDRLGARPIPIGYYDDLGVTGLFAHKRLGSFVRKVDGWVLRSAVGVGIILTIDGYILRGPVLRLMRPGQKKTEDYPLVNLISTPKTAYAFCSNPGNGGIFSDSGWHYRIETDIDLYLDDMAAFIARHGGGSSE